MNPINPVCRPATENEINYGEAKWCAICTSECDSKGKDELVMCDYFKTNDREATREKSSRVGNAAKMRETLGEISREIWESIDPFCNDDCCKPKRELAKMADAALAAPPRNCDRLSKAEVLEMLKDRSFSKEDTIEWLYDEAKGETK